jgi:Uma2 family endonuclease
MATTQLLTIDDALAMDLPEFWELIEGELFDVSPSTPRSSSLGLRIGSAILTYVDEHELGSVSGEQGGIVLETDPDSLVTPDVSFFSNETLPSGFPASGYPRIRPDLAVEIVSPSDRPSHIRAKQALYRRAGVPMV